MLIGVTSYLPACKQKASLWRYDRYRVATLEVGYWPAARLRHDARKRPHSLVCGRLPQLDFSLLRDFQRVIDLDAKIPDGAFELGMAKQQLNGPQVLGALVDQRRLSPAHRMRSVSR